MRWIKKVLKEGMWRERSAFLFFPKSINNENGDRETRWLEHATWREKYIGRGDSGTDYWGYQEWIEEELISKE